MPSKSKSNVCYSCCYGYCYKAQSKTPIQLNFELKLAFDLLSPANQTLPNPFRWKYIWSHTHLRKVDIEILA